jgi:hypothetical protein
VAYWPDGLLHIHGMIEIGITQQKQKVAWQRSSAFRLSERKLGGSEATTMIASVEPMLPAVQIRQVLSRLMITGR